MIRARYDDLLPPCPLRGNTFVPDISTVRAGFIRDRWTMTDHSGMEVRKEGQRVITLSGSSDHCLSINLMTTLAIIGWGQFLAILIHETDHLVLGG